MFPLCRNCVVMFERVLITAVSSCVCFLALADQCVVVTRLGTLVWCVVAVNEPISSALSG